MQLRHISFTLLVSIATFGIVATGGCGGSDGKPGKVNTGPTDLAGFATTHDFAEPPVDMATTPDDLSMNTSLCSAATSIMNGTKLTAQDTASATETLDGACLSSSDGAVLFYKATIPAGNKLTVTVTPSFAFDPVVRIIDTCSATSCLGSADVNYEGEDEELSYSNTGTAARDVIVAVGGIDFASSGTFDLAVKIAAPPPPAVNAVCANAIVLAADGTLPGQDLAGATESLSSVCQVSAKTGVLYYSVSVPANTKVEATVTPSGLDAVIRVLSACGAATCLSSADEENANVAETATYINTTAAAVPIILAVGGYGMTNSGTFTLSTKSTVLPAVPSNVACNMPVALVSNMTLVDQTLNGATEKLSTKCQSVATGPSIFYSATVPADQILVSQVTPTGPSWDMVLRLFGACSDTSCLSSVDEGDTGEGEVLSYRNTSGAAKPIVLAAGNYTASTLVTFNLASWLSPFATNTTCAAAIPLVDGTMRFAEDGEGATTAIGSTCVPSAGGKVLYYSASVPPGKTMKVRVTPIGKWDPIIRLFDSCAATACLAYQDSGNSGEIETLTYVNGGTTDKSLFIAVGSYATTTKPFHIEVGIF